MALSNQYDEYNKIINNAFCLVAYDINEKRLDKFVKSTQWSEKVQSRYVSMIPYITLGTTLMGIHSEYIHDLKNEYILNDDFSITLKDVNNKFNLELLQKRKCIDTPVELDCSQIGIFNKMRFFLILVNLKMVIQKNFTCRYYEILFKLFLVLFGEEFMKRIKIKYACMKEVQTYLSEYQALKEDAEQYDEQVIRFIYGVKYSRQIEPNEFVKYERALFNVYSDLILDEKNELLLWLLGKNNKDCVYSANLQPIFVEHTSNANVEEAVLRINREDKKVFGPEFEGYYGCLICLGWYATTPEFIQPEEFDEAKKLLLKEDIEVGSFFD